MTKLKRNEKIKDVKGYEGLYAVTTHGRVWSYRRKIWLSPLLTGNGYPTVRFCVDCNYLDRKVHRLVAEAFIGNPDNKPQINHINGVKTDNRVSNLEWCTARENLQHAGDTGLNKVFKLTYEDKILICQIYDTFGVSKTRLAAIFCVSVPAICYIITHYSNLANSL